MPNPLIDPNVLQGLIGQGSGWHAPMLAPTLASNQPMDDQVPSLSATIPASDDSGDDSSSDQSQSSPLSPPPPGPMNGPPTPPPQDPSAAAAGSDPMIGGMTLGNLQNSLNQYYKTRQTGQIIGAIGDALANQQSAGNMLLNERNPQQNITGQIMQNIPNQFQDNLNVLKQYMMMKQMGGYFTPAEQAQQQLKLAPQGESAIFDKNGNYAGVTTLQGSPRAVMAQSAADRVGAMNQGNAIKIAGQANDAANSVTGDKTINPLVSTASSLVRAQSILTNPNAPVTTSQFNVAYNDLVNSLTNSNNATDGKINRELPSTLATQWNTLRQKLGQNDDLRATPQGAQLIALTLQNIGTLNNDIDSAVAGRAKSLAQGSSIAFPNNQAAINARNAKANYYINGQWRRDIQPSQPGGDGISLDVLNYAQSHGMSPQQAFAIKNARLSQQGGQNMAGQ